MGDIYFFRGFLRVGKHVEAFNPLYVFLVVDCGALLGFALLLIFLTITDLSFRSHWSSAFVAGASALNLLAVNSASLLMRAMHHYQQHHLALSLSKFENEGVN